MPFKYSLEPISSVLTTAYFPDDPKIETKQLSMEMAIADWCDHQEKCHVPINPLPKYPVIKYATFFVFSGDYTYNLKATTDFLNSNIACYELISGSE